MQAKDCLTFNFHHHRCQQTFGKEVENISRHFPSAYLSCISLSIHRSEQTSAGKWNGKVNLTSISNQKSSSPSDLSNLTSFFCIYATSFFFCGIYTFTKPEFLSLFVQYLFDILSLRRASISGSDQLHVAGIQFFFSFQYLSIFCHSVVHRVQLFNICSIFCRCTESRSDQFRVFHFCKLYYS